MAVSLKAEVYFTHLVSQGLGIVPGLSYAFQDVKNENVLELR